MCAESLMQKLYENQGHLDDESAIVATICEWSDTDAYKLPMKNRLDYVLYRGRKISSLLEVKRRHCDMRRYPDFMIAANKVMYARQISEYFGLKCFLAVQWNDALGLVNMKQHKRIWLNGRKDRADADDIELQAYYDIDDFQIIKGR